MDAVFTLFEKDFHLGVCVLLNSLAKNGFEGKFFLYFKGEAPTWIDSAIKNSHDYNIELVARKIDCHDHMAQMKAQIALRILGELNENDSLFYFDPDIVLKVDWGFMQRWSGRGFTLIEEIARWRMSSNHPQRLSWADWATNNGFKLKREMSQYLNSGYFSCRHSSIEILEIWDSILHKAVQQGFRHDKINRKENELFSTWDQDALNLALMLSTSEISTMGPEEMDFRPGGYTMSHAVGTRKPWRLGYLSAALKGLPPRQVDKLFWLNSIGPIVSLPSKLCLKSSVTLPIASAIGRIYKRF